jgi:hypothetical protein
VSTQTFDLGGLVALSIDEPEDAELAFLSTQMDPYRATSAPTDAPAVVLERENGAAPPLVELHRDAGDGRLTGSDGERFYVLDGDRRFAVAPPDAVPGRFGRQPGFPLWRVYGSVIRPAMHMALLQRRAVALHSASVVLDGAGVVVAGWSESGKTETALAFAEEGARFLSDKWTLLGPDGSLSIFPMRVGVRRWVLRYLPRLRSSLPAGARGQMLAAGAAGVATRPLRRLGATGRVSGRAVGAAEKAVALADRTSLTLSELAGAYGHRADPDEKVPLRALALLTTVPDGAPRAERANSDWVARRLARTAAFERRELFQLHDRARFAFPGWADAGQASLAEEERLLREALANVPVIEVKAPFPVDPRLVAQAVSALL